MNQQDLHFLIPLYNDWAAAHELIPMIDDVLTGQNCRARVLLIDDASTAQPAANFSSWSLRSIERVEVLRLRRNLGHQRAICIGLVSLYERRARGLVVIMDADGEDKPSDIPQLVEACRKQGESAIVFAGRRRRAEGVIFRAFYGFFLLVHRVFVGFRVRVGNFSVVPFPVVENLVVISELWNHYAASVFRARIPYTIVPTARGKRLTGKSKMTLVSLVAHGLSAIAVYSDTVGTRILIGSAALVASLGACLVALLALHLGGRLIVPPWTNLVMGFLAVILFQAVLLSFVMALFMLYGRSSFNFVPQRDCGVYAGEMTVIYPRNA
jgi:polyisoprenyl-phosphate glycosyltransferase